MKKIYLGFLFFTVVYCFTFQNLKAENIYKKLSVLQCDSLIQANETNPNFVILDVRTPSSWQSDHLLGSINRNYYDSDFDQQIDALPHQKVYLIHCQSGSRSSGTFIKMQNFGFAEVYEMSGGISSWKSALLPTTSVIEPKLMLVSYNEITGNSGTDTIKVTITNRANNTLSFNSIDLFDIHEIYSDFDTNSQLAGAEDYTFKVFHVPGYSGVDSTSVKVESNGGNLELNLLFKNGVIQDILNPKMPDLKIYPNPCADFLMISGNVEQLKTISLINMSGQIVFRKTNHFNVNEQINVQSLQNGTYLLQLESGLERSVQKIIIRH